MYFDILSVIKQLFPGTLSTAILKVRSYWNKTPEIYTEVSTAFQENSCLSMEFGILFQENVLFFLEQ